MKVRTIVRATILAAVLSGMAAPVVLAQENKTADIVTLKSPDGQTQLRGKLTKFDGLTYTLETAIGTLSISSDKVECDGDGCPQNKLFGVAFGIHGSNTIGAELMPALIQGYADSLDAELITELGKVPNESRLRIIHEDGREMAAIDLKSQGSTSSFKSLADRVAEIGMSSRRAGDKDIPQLVKAGMTDPRNTPAEHVVGLDGLIVIVHRDNPIRSISLEEIALIFSGTATNWSQFGGPDKAINVYVRDEKSGMFETFRTLTLAPHGVDVAKSAKRFESNIQLSDSVSRDIHGIGVTASAFRRASRALPIRQECGILSYPTTFAMKAEEYPLSRRLYLYSPRRVMSAHARNLISFIKSDAAQSVIEENGFVSLSVERASLNSQGSRLVHAITGEEEVSLEMLREFLNDVKNGVRLSTTFRFTPGERGLEPKSQRDAQRFAKDLAAGKFAGKEVMLIGFTDSVGQFELNRQLSAGRAQVVADVLAAAVPEGALAKAKIIVKGYGELAPVGCNTTSYGRSSNRRVEVWIRDPA